MNFKHKQRWKIILNYIVGWAMAIVFLSIVRGEGTKELGSVEIEFWNWNTILSIFIFAPVFGFISGFIQIFIEEHGYKRTSFRNLLILRAIFLILFLLTIIGLTYPMFGSNTGFIEYAFEPGSFALYFYIVWVDITMFIIRQINLFLGSNNFWNILNGKFYTPREEERIFMFLDLQASTKHAEQLGHVTYSKMIQDCFNDLGIVSKNESEIYQYVGDEIVLSWDFAKGVKNQNCLMAYFNFQMQLDKKQEYYMKNYNCKPFFKAGLNAGKVTVTEIGKYKKEIAYHGDVINTAARIQGKCNEYKQQLLISKNLKDILGENHSFLFNKIGNVEIRGKKKTVSIYSVNQKNS
ncbi:adenylate/guanylate cyclase domain-containing protein [Aquimarina sp. 2201CG5-10]|uniref:adenylate/guanylate cyclase domain-containing protein n=1 Tax=Aquimarina callyspongiae TaxID=3098150 RepID=UPI002AB3409F|nr:adenylate/guanylate cyclase domain-containing protein [Aquimarina sp. 2201CG5-10]MDY8135504.1 adenylate/guanylate cyclase domain-containing protein [Aquimarina sp. 2201CG5-10]